MKYKIRTTNKKELIIYGWITAETVYMEAINKLLPHLPLSTEEKNGFVKYVKRNYMTSKTVEGHIYTRPEFFHANPQKYLAMLKRIIKGNVKNRLQNLADEYLRNKKPEKIVAEVSDSFVIDIKQTSATLRDQITLQRFLVSNLRLLEKPNKILAKDIKPYAFNNRHILKLFRYTIIRHGAVCHTTRKA